MISNTIHTFLIQLAIRRNRSARSCGAPLGTALSLATRPPRQGEERGSDEMDYTFAMPVNEVIRQASAEEKEAGEIVQAYTEELQGIAEELPARVAQFKEYATASTLPSWPPSLTCLTLSLRLYWSAPPLPS